MDNNDDLKHFGKLLADIGLNPDRPLSTKQAFLKHLIKAAKDLEPRPAPTFVEGEQLTFDPALIGVAKRSR